MCLVKRCNTSYMQQLCTIVCSEVQTADCFCSRHTATSDACHCKTAWNRLGTLAVCHMFGVPRQTLQELLVVRHQAIDLAQQLLHKMSANACIRKSGSLIKIECRRNVTTILALFGCTRLGQSRWSACQAAARCCKRWKATPSRPARRDSWSWPAIIACNHNKLQCAAFAAQVT
jgi:hypothetical protein